METTTRESKPLVELDTIDASGRPPSEPCSDSSELLAIGRYRVLGRIGAGGMGTVWAAHDPMLGREVAIKLARVDGPGSLESRLLREARLLAQVRHPNVVEIHEIGQFRGQIYIVMARIHGQTLRAWQRERPRTWRATVAKYVAAARGLQAAHAAGLVHRDFKAENVLVGDDERVYVVDFGLARPTGVALEGGVEGPSPALSLSSDSPLTRTGAVVGTPAYMAPEQRAGRPPDVRSDIYSFCVSLHEALHGQRPGSKPEATATRKREVPRRIDRALARGLAPAASQRYASLEPLIGALGRDPGRWWRRVGLAAALVVIGGFAGLMASDGGEPRAASCEAAIRRLDRAWGDPQRAALEASFAGPGEYARAAGRRVALALDAYADEWQQARLRACEATTTLSASAAAQLHAQLACLDQAAEGLGRAAEVLAFAGGADAEQAMGVVQALPPIAGCKAQAANVARDMSEKAGVRDELRRALIAARAQAAGGDRRAGLRLAEQVGARAQGLGEPALAADALLTAGRLRAEDGEIVAAETRLLAAIDVAEAHGLDDITASGWVALATVAARLRVSPERMHERARRAQALLDRLGDEGPRRATLLNALGVAAAAEGRFAEAVGLHREAYARLRFSEGPTLELIRSLQSLGNALALLGRRDEAEARLVEAQGLCAEQLGPRHPQRARVSHDLAVLLLEAGEQARARALLEEALAIWSETYGASCVECGRAHASLMGQASATGELGRAEHHARQALAIYRQVLPAEHPDLAAALVNLGAVLHWRGDFSGAVPAYAEALRLQERVLPEGHLHRAITESNLGESLVALQRHPEALQRFAAAEPVARAAGEPGEELLLLVLRNKALALQGTGELGAARVALEQARALLKRDPERAQEFAEVEQQLSQLRPQVRAG